jgi:hypothetical protein
MDDLHRDPAGSLCLRGRERGEVHRRGAQVGCAVLVVGCEQQQVVEEGF